jgi:hypothetical protein
MLARHLLAEKSSHARNRTPGFPCLQQLETKKDSNRYTTSADSTLFSCAIYVALL